MAGPSKGSGSSLGKNRKHDQDKNRRARKARKIQKRNGNGKPPKK